MILSYIAIIFEKTTSFLHGNIVEVNLPWIAQLKSDLQELNISAICLCKAENDVLSHADRSDVSTASTTICKLNYVIQDSNSVIYVTNDNGEDSSLAVKDAALLMNVVRHHRVRSDNSQLYTLQICFYKSYNEVVEWFQAHPNLFYSG